MAKLTTALDAIETAILDAGTNSRITPAILQVTKYTGLAPQRFPALVMFVSTAHPLGKGRDEAWQADIRLSVWVQEQRPEKMLSELISLTDAVRKEINYQKTKFGELKLELQEIRYGAGLRGPDAQHMAPFVIGTLRYTATWHEEWI